MIVISAVILLTRVELDCYSAIAQIGQGCARYCVMPQTAGCDELLSDALLERAWHHHLRVRQPALPEVVLPQPLAMPAAPPAASASALTYPDAPIISLPAASPRVPPSTVPVPNGRWSTAAIVSCVGLASSITAAIILYQLRHHPRIQPILQPLLRALHFSPTPFSSSSTSYSTSASHSQDAAPPSLPHSSADKSLSESLVTVDEQQLIRLFHLSLHALQSTGSIDGELEQALYRHLRTTAYPSPSTRSSSASQHAALQFVAVQWLLLYSTLQLNNALSAEQYDTLQAETLHTHMPLCWALLASIHLSPQSAPEAQSAEPHTRISESALSLLRLDVAQRLHDPERMNAVFDEVWREKDSGEAWTIEEAVVLCTAAPHIGRCDEMLQLADWIQQAGANGSGDGMQLFHESATHRRDIVDYQVVVELARDEMERRRRVRGQSKRKDTDDEHKEQQSSTAASATSSSLFSPLPEPSIAPPTSLSACVWSEHILLACDSLYCHVRCSHPHLQEQAERIHQPASSYTPCPVLPSSAIRLTRLGYVVSLHSPLSPQLHCFGLVCEDGWMRLAGWREAEEGPGGTVRWREEWRLAEVVSSEEERDSDKVGVGRWEGERMVERLRRKYAIDVDEEQVRVRWTWKVRLQLQMQPSGS